MLEALTPQPQDKILVLMAQFREDPRPSKIDLGVGVYRTGQGDTPVFGAIKAAERKLVEEQDSKAYLGPEGDMGFVHALMPYVFGKSDPTMGGRIEGMQTPGGTGAAKCGGNYAASLVPTAEAFAKGHDQVLFLDAAEHRWIEELGGMNLFFAFADGSLSTPALTGTILPGITRDSLIQLAREEGIEVREERYSLDQWRADAASGQLLEAFACGTAAVVTPVGKVAGKDGEFTIGSGGPGQLTGKLKARLTAIQRGEEADKHGWVHRIG